MDIAEIKSILATLPARFYGANIYDDREIAAALRVVYNQSPFRHYGKRWTREAEQFEEAAARFYGTKYALAVNSGTGALILALHALEVGPGDEVIVPAFFWISISNAVLLRGGVPVLCEIDSTLNMDPEDLRRKITPKTKCVIAVHMFGGQADIERIQRTCKERGIHLLEDFSQCNGASVAGARLGSFGDIGISSLQLNKAITSGEGGLIVADDFDLVERAAARSDLGYGRAAGISSSDTTGSTATVGEGRRFNEISAAIMRVQLEKLPAMVESMREVALRITKRIDLPKDVTFRRIVDERGHHGSTATMVFPSLEQAAEFMAVGRRLFGETWLPVHLQDLGQHIYYNCTNLVEKLPVLPGGFPWNLPENRGEYRYAKGSCPTTDSLLARSVGMQLPPDLSGLHQEAIIAAINEVLAAS